MNIFDFVSNFNLLGTPDTSLSGLSTLNARKAFTSKPSICIIFSTVLIILEAINGWILSVRKKILSLTYPITTIKKSNKFHPLRRYEPGCIVNPSAIIFIKHSVVKMTKNMYSMLSCGRKLIRKVNERS